MRSTVCLESTAAWAAAARRTKGRELGGLRAPDHVTAVSQERVTGQVAWGAALPYSFHPAAVPVARGHGPSASTSGELDRPGRSPGGRFTLGTVLFSTKRQT